MKPTHEILEAPKQEYDLMVWNIYLNWAGIYATNSIMFQQMLVNKSITNWFNCEYSKLNKEFKKAVTPYQHLKPKDKRKLFVNIVGRIYEIHPKPLIDEYKGIPNKFSNHKYTLN